MGQISQDILIVSSGSFHFVPSGSVTTGVSQSFNSIPQTYVVTMSGASLSQSVLAPIGETASYFYLRQPDNYAFKFYYTSVSQSGNTFTTSVQPTGSLLPNISTPSSSIVDISLPLNATGSLIHKLTVSRLKSLPRLAQGRFTVSSSNSKYVFITNTPSGVPPSDDFNLSYISGSSFSYQVITSGSGLLNQSISEGTPVLTSASMTYGLDPDNRQSAKITLPASSSHINLKDGFYGIISSNPSTGSQVSLHGGPPLDYGQDLPNPAYIKTPGGFDILLDSGNGHDNSNFRVWKNTGLGGVTGELLLKVNDSGDLTVSGSILGGTF